MRLSTLGCTGVAVVSIGPEGRLWCVEVKVYAAVTAGPVWLCVFLASVVACRVARAVAVLAAAVAASALRTACVAALVSCSNSRRLFVDSCARRAVVSAVAMATSYK